RHHEHVRDAVAGQQVGHAFGSRHFSVVSELGHDFEIRSPSSWPGLARPSRLGTHCVALLSGMRGSTLAALAARPRMTRQVVLSCCCHLIASGLTGEPTAPVIGMAGPTNMNS